MPTVAVMARTLDGSPLAVNGSIFNIEMLQLTSRRSNSGPVVLSALNLELNEASCKDALTAEELSTIPHLDLWCPSRPGELIGYSGLPVSVLLLSSHRISPRFVGNVFI